LGYYCLCMNLMSKRKSLLKSDEIARIVAAVEELAGDSVAHDGSAIVKNDGAVDAKQKGKKLEI